MALRATTKRPMALRATTKAGLPGVVCDDLWRDHGGGMVNKFPACRYVLAPSLRGTSGRRRTRKPVVPAGHQKTAERSARKSQRGWRSAQPRKPAMLGVVCDDLERDHGGGMVNKFPASRHVPAPSLRGIPRRRRTRKPAVPAGHEKTAARSARKSRKYDHPTIALSTFQPFNCSTLRSVFVLGRRPISCPAKRGFVSTGSGGDAAHRKGRGWPCPSSGSGPAVAGPC